MANKKQVAKKDKDVFYFGLIVGFINGVVFVVALYCIFQTIIA